MFTSSIMLLLTTGLVTIGEAFPLDESVTASSSTSATSPAASATAAPGPTDCFGIKAGIEGYAYSNLPAGTTQVCNDQTVDFLQNTTGAPTLQAPQPNDAVPADAAVYHPSAPIMNMTDFRIWHDDLKANSGGGSQKFMKVAPGIYEFSKGTGFPLDWNNNMAFNGFTGWTLDLRGW